MISEGSLSRLSACVARPRLTVYLDVSRHLTWLVPQPRHKTRNRA
jgi:hypothetical protein